VALWPSALCAARRRVTFFSASRSRLHRSRPSHSEVLTRANSILPPCRRLLQRHHRFQCRDVRLDSLSHERNTPPDRRSTVCDEKVHEFDLCIDDRRDGERIGVEEPHAAIERI